MKLKEALHGPFISGEVIRFWYSSIKLIVNLKLFKDSLILDLFFKHVNLLIKPYISIELKYQKLLYSVSSLNSILDLTLPGLITFTSVTFFILFAKAPLTPSYIVLAMV